MGRLTGKELRLKLLALLMAFSLVPMATMGIISMMEMNQATRDVQEKISNLSTTLNRSALTVAPDEADQVQLAAAKAKQYEEIFKRIRAENELVANYTALSRQGQNCSSDGVWIAPVGPNETSQEERRRSVCSLSAATMILQSVVEANPDASLGYIGTEDGVLVTWPRIDERLYKVAPFDYKERPSYVAARAEGKTAWTRTFSDERSTQTLTCTTPIYRSREFFGVAGVDVSLEGVSSDLASIGGRGFPFIVDSSGAIVMQLRRGRPNLNDLFAGGNISKVSSPEIRELAHRMIGGEMGSSVVGLGVGDVYVAYAPIPTVGWSFGIAYPAEEMSLPARFIDAGIRDVARSATQGIEDAAKTIWASAASILILAAIIAAASGIIISRRIAGEVSSLAAAADRVAGGDLDLAIVPSGVLGDLAEAFAKMVGDLKSHVTRLEKDAVERGSAQREREVWSEIKKSLLPGRIPSGHGYEIAALSIPSDKRGFDYYDFLEMGDERIGMAMVDISGAGVPAAILAVTSRALIRASPPNIGPAEVLKEANAQLNEAALDAHLACFYAQIDPASCAIDYANAGFTPPFIVDLGGSVDTLGGGGIALGMLDRIDLRAESIPVQPGDVLVVYSDGVTEAMNGRGKPFGTDRLITVVRESRALPPGEILREVERRFREHTKEAGLRDDFIIVIFKWL
jgi:sigma-B regulation protein RsbU (phosphoserine phosphatase)